MHDGRRLCRPWVERKLGNRESGHIAGDDGETLAGCGYTLCNDARQCTELLLRLGACLGTGCIRVTGKAACDGGRFDTQCTD